MDLWSTLLPLLLIDVLNPVLFALLIVAVGSDRPTANSSALIAGHTVAYFVVGILIAMGLDQISNRLANPKPIDFGISMAAGVLCLWAALGARNGGASKTKEPERELTPLYCFGFGAVVNFIGAPFAVPYFAALGQILKADLGTDGSLAVLVGYNLAYAFPFAMVPLLVAIMGDRSKPFLHKISDMLTGLVDKLMPIILSLLGLALIADSISFFARGHGLF